MLNEQQPVTQLVTLRNVTVNQHQSAGLCFMLNDDGCEADVSIANPKSLHMLWFWRTTSLHQLLRGLSFPRSFIIFIGHCDNLSLQMKDFIPENNSSTLESISGGVLLDILWPSRVWTETLSYSLSLDVQQNLLIGCNSAPTMVLNRKRCPLFKRMDFFCFF